MFEQLEIQRTTRPAEAAGVEVVEYVRPEADLTCPYFHQRFFTPDGRRFVCSGELEGTAEAVLIDRETAEAWRLTEGGANVHTGDLAPDGRTFYFVRGAALWSVDLGAGEETERFPLPNVDGYACSGCLHRNVDGMLLAGFANREHASGVKEGRVWTLDTQTGEAGVVVERPFQIGHVQFSTTDPGLVMYCHETGGSSPQRMWLARTDGQHSGALFDEPGHPWVTHETFSGDGSAVVFIRHRDGMGVIRPDNTGFEALDAPGAWHPGPNHDASWIVHDTHRGEIRLHSRATGESVLVANDEIGKPDKHPHPRFARDNRTIVWTCSRGGHARPALADVTGVTTDREAAS